MVIGKTIEEKVKELEDRVRKLEEVCLSQNITVSRTKEKNLSAKEFLITKAVQTDVQKTLVFAYYLEYVDGMASFNTADLETVFRSAKEKPPKNINDAVNKNISRGFLMDAKEKKDTKKAWVLTSTGEKFVETELGKNGQE